MREGGVGSAVPGGFLLCRSPAGMGRLRVWVWGWLSAGVWLLLAIGLVETTHPVSRLLSAKKNPVR